jgi:hypothetical protein
MQHVLQHVIDMVRSHGAENVIDFSVVQTFFGELALARPECNEVCREGMGLILTSEKGRSLLGLKITNGGHQELKGLAAVAASGEPVRQQLLKVEGLLARVIRAINAGEPGLDSAIAVVRLLASP